MPLVVAHEVSVTLLADADRQVTADVVAAFEAKLARALAVLEDELRAEFGDVAIDH